MWERYSDSYPKDFQHIVGYTFDETIQDDVAIYNPKSWTKFISFIKGKLTEQENKFAQLLNGGDYSVFSQLSCNIHEQEDLLFTAEAISELDVDKGCFENLFENVYNSSVENILCRK